ncbi:RNA-directed DNA polymerase [Bradyrhizobium sp. AZCC 1678]|uniref:reverse transcriptase family protein n=1 Tax=Bradyrhizobium sp. AZCC 1678 TaxID=3117030 RepID=UPI002FEF20D0
MISASPNLYRKIGAERSIDPQIIERALKQAGPPESRGLPAVLTLRHLAHLTGASYSYLRQIVERSSDAYKPFLIRKRRGGARAISAPEPQLAAVQKWIAINILNKLRPHVASSAYAPGSSPIHCATRHLGATWVVKVDIHDFFESISERSVYDVFRGAGYQPLIALEFARLCTRLPHGQEAGNSKWRIQRRGSGTIKPYRTWAVGHLPQGAPSSPMLANLTSLRLDSVLQALADRNGLTYTRYSDDIVFSTGGYFDGKRAGTLLNEVDRIFKSFGHALHRKKVSVAPPGARKVVLGLLVHGDRLRLTKDYRARLADHVRGLDRFGLAAHAEHRDFASIWGMVRHVRGLLNYAIAVEGLEAMDSLRKKLDAVLAREGWPNLPKA